MAGSASAYEGKGRRSVLKKKMLSINTTRRDGGEEDKKGEYYFLDFLSSAASI
jgi:hypothetical protein